MKATEAVVYYGTDLPFLGKQPARNGLSQRCPTSLAFLIALLRPLLDDVSHVTERSQASNKPSVVHRICRKP